MKSFLLSVVLFSTLLLGCKFDPSNAHIAKATVLGIHIVPGGSSPQAPAIDIGLIRYQYLSTPKGIAITSHVDATIGALTQHAVEDVKISPVE